MRNSNLAYKCFKAKKTTILSKCRRGWLFMSTLELVIGVAWVFLACVIDKASSLIVGTEVCACSPPTYEFTFNFDLTCPPVEVFGDGVEETTCLISSFGGLFGDEISKNVPVSVSSISIIETNVERRPIAQNMIVGDFVDGSSFSYSSITALSTDPLEINEIPKTIQLTITGQNIDGETLLNVWAIRYSNDCGIYPALNEDDSAGWTVITRLGVPSQELCSAAPSITDVPTVLPTIISSSPPTNQGTDPKPDKPKSLTPTTLPTESPTKAPTSRPTDPPTIKRTVAPTVLPSSAPTENPTEGPTKVQTISPTTEPTKSPTKRPTEKPTKAPKRTKSPTLPPTSFSDDEPESQSPSSKPSFMSFDYVSFDLGSEDNLLVSEDGLLIESEFGRTETKLEKRSRSHRTKAAHRLRSTRGRRGLRGDT